MVTNRGILINSLLITVSLFLTGCYSRVKPEIDKEALLVKTEEAYSYCKANNLNTDFCIMVDMSLHSGLYRMFVWDFGAKKIIKKGMVSHGCGDKVWGRTLSKTNVVFSNTSDSHCSSDGKYKIGSRAYSNWGINIKYWLHGLEKTNSNAVKRVVVLHSWDRISDEEVFPKGTPEGWGCPAVSNNMMKYLDNKLKASKKPVLFWVYK